MLSKIYFLIVFFASFNCYEAYVMNATRCHTRSLIMESSIVLDKGPEQCREDEDVCTFFAAFYGQQLDQYSHGCSNRTNVPSEHDPEKTTFVNVTGDGSQICIAVEHRGLTKFHCKCEENLCNDNNTPLYKELMRMYKNQTGLELELIYTDPPYVPSEDDDEDVDDYVDTMDDFGGNGAIGKPTMIILSLGLMIHSRIIV